MSRSRGDDKAGTLSARVMDQIGTRIVSGAYKVGATLPPEHMLCEEYGLSRTPLREAMKTLHAKRLVVMGPKSGTRVLPESCWNQLDPDLLRWRFASGPDEWLLGQLQELRIAFEPEACRLAAQNGSAAAHVVIREAFERLASASADPSRTIDPDVAFHMSIASATQNIFLVSITGAVSTALHMQFQLAAEREIFPASELEQHRLICDAILARDGEAAARHMRALIGQSRASLVEALPRMRGRRRRPAASAAVR